MKDYVITFLMFAGFGAFVGLAFAFAILGGAA